MIYSNSAQSRAGLMTSCCFCSKRAGDPVLDEWFEIWGPLRKKTKLSRARQMSGLLLLETREKPDSAKALFSPAAV
jgi:hypothetical protein